VFITDGTKDVLLSTGAGHEHPLPESEVRSMGRQAYGVKGITLEQDDEVVGADVVEPGTTILTVTENGYGKRTEEAEYRVQGRGGKGIIDIKTTERNGNVVGLAQVKDRDEVMLVTNGGMLIRIKVHDISVIGRNTQGVRLISLESAGREGEQHLQAARVGRGERRRRERRGDPLAGDRAQGPGPRRGRGVLSLWPSSGPGPSESSGATSVTRRWAPGGSSRGGGGGVRALASGPSSPTGSPGAGLAGRRGHPLAAAGSLPRRRGPAPRAAGSSGQREHPSTRTEPEEPRHLRVQ
jgi:DNA gyrase subunit A